MRCGILFGGYSKKGSGHFEMIISFVFFVGFVSFMVFTVSPYSDNNDFVGPVMDGFYDAFEEEATTDLTTVFLRVNGSQPGGQCVDLYFSDEVFEDYGDTIGKTFEGSAATATLTKVGGQHRLRVRAANPNNDYDFVLSSSFPFQTLPVVPPCILHVEGVGNINQRMVFYNESLFNMSRKYYTDYEDLRDKMKIPFIYDFSITNDKFPELNMVRSIPDDVEVYTEEYGIEVLKSAVDGIESANFVLKVW